MSAPDTNIETQARRHKPALYGIAGAILIAAAAAAVLVTWDDLTPTEQAAPAVAEGATQ